MEPLKFLKWPNGTTQFFGNGIRNNPISKKKSPIFGKFLPWNHSIQNLNCAPVVQVLSKVFDSVSAKRDSCCIVKKSHGIDRKRIILIAQTFPTQFFFSDLHVE